MSNVLINNSYNILGLESSSTEKEILRRSREIINLIEIDEIPEYDSDIGPVKKLRTVQNVKKASQNLSDPKKRIKEYFFWFDLQDSIDEEAIKYIKEQHFSKAINIWKEKIEKNDSKKYFYQKNLAILYLVLLAVNTDSDSYLKKSLGLWKSFIKLDKFWNYYLKVYKLNDNLNTNEKILNNFREDILGYLSDVYTELSQNKNKNYITEYSKTFNFKGKILEKDVLNPIYTNINEAVEELEAMNISEDGIIDAEENAKVKSLINKFQDELNKIIELGLYEDSQAKMIRDRAATAIRKTVLDIYNHLRDTEKSIALLKIASQIGGTAGMIHKIKKDIKIIEKNKKDDEIVEPIVELVKEKKWEKALKIILNQETKHKDNTELQKFFSYHKKMCVTLTALDKASEARKKMDAKSFNEGKELYKEVIDLVEDNLDLYNVNKKQLSSYISDIKSLVSKVTVRNISQVDDFRKNTWEMIDKNFKEDNEVYILKCYMDAYM
ncbi:hypothetical protein ACFL25_01340, partial [Patescibacteria group bacterium]